MVKKTLSLFLSLLFFLSFPLATFASTVDDIKNIVRSEFVGDINGDLNKANTIEEIMEMLDPYSTYFTASEFEAFLNSVDLTSVGIGVVIEKHEKGILLLQVIEGASAELAGVMPGDIITAINGAETAPMSVQEASSLILGKPNTPVTLTFLKLNGSTVTKSLVRKAFSLPNVTTELLYGDVGYITLSSFSNDAVSLISKAVQKLKTDGATSFILDLQNNGGGYVSAAEQLTGMFSGAIHAYKLKEASKTTTVRAIAQSVKFPTQTKVLINRYSASASEMLAASLLDQQAAVLYGETTYGKGSMQTFFELNDGGYLKLTVGHFTGPANTVINKVGVEPNIPTTSNPIYQAHFDTIVEQYARYHEKTNLLNVPTSKTFTVNFNGTLASSIDSSSVELVQLGGQSVDVTIKPNGHQLLVTPVAPLVAGGEYALIIHPIIKDSNGKMMKKGYYLHITVAK